MLKIFVAVAAASLAFAPLAHAAGDMNGPVKTMKVKGRTVLTDGKGMTLYTFDKDGRNKSNCTGGCASIWPPMMASSKAMKKGGLSTFKRPDGSMQWAYKGKPLYAWKNDRKPGDMTGDGFKGVWHAATK